MACTIVEEGLYDEGFLKERVAGFEEFRHFVQSWSPERAASICGVEAQQIREAARLYAKEGPAMCLPWLGADRTYPRHRRCDVSRESCSADWEYRQGRVPASILLRGQNNVQGAAHMGCDPGILTGSVSLKEGRDLFSSVWQAPYQQEKV